jgi:hypothetical protein
MRRFVDLDQYDALCAPVSFSNEAFIFGESPGRRAVETIVLTFSCTNRAWKQHSPLFVPGDDFASDALTGSSGAVGAKVNAGETIANTAIRRAVRETHGTLFAKFYLQHVKAYSSCSYLTASAMIAPSALLLTETERGLLKLPSSCQAPCP